MFSGVVFFDKFGEGVFIERVELFDADECGIFDFMFFLMGEEVVVDFA